jgi:hypothetical protein
MPPAASQVPWLEVMGGTHGGFPLAGRAMRIIMESRKTMSRAQAPRKRVEVERSEPL